MVLVNSVVWQSLIFVIAISEGQFLHPSVTLHSLCIWTSPLTFLAAISHHLFQIWSSSAEIPKNFHQPYTTFISDFSLNELTGPVPFSVGGLQNFATIYLYHYSLNGIIPSSLYNLISSEVIYLSEKKLTGSISSCIFELVNLTKVSLSSNNLSGNVELYMFTELKSLEVLDLSYNKVTNCRCVENWGGLNCLKLKLFGKQENFVKKKILLIFDEINITALTAHSSFSLLILYSSLNTYNKEFRDIHSILKLIQAIQLLNYKHLTPTFYKYI